jgi:hypothetical protein
MNALVLLMALLALSYVSGLIGRGRAGLPSGSEWVILGALLGPGLLGVVDRGVQSDVEPVVYVAIGWVALVMASSYGVVRGRRIGAGRLLLGVFLGAITVAAVGGVAWWLVPFVGPSLDPRDRMILALGLGAVASETTSNVVRGVIERHGATGPLAQLLEDLAAGKDLAPVLAAGVALCLHPRLELVQRLPLPELTLPAAVVVTGALLGVVATLMLARETRTEQSWGIIVGTTLLAVGTAARLGLPVVVALFSLGLCAGVALRPRGRLSALLEPTKRGALLPSLLLAGARIDAPLLLKHGPIVAAVVATRLGILYLTGLAVAPLGRAPAASSQIGPAMLPAGELSMILGLTFALTFSGPIGEAVLIAAIAVTFVGELVGPFAVRAALRRAGELNAAPVVEQKELVA